MLKKSTKFLIPFILFYGLMSSIFILGEKIGLYGTTPFNYNESKFYFNVKFDDAYLMYSFDNLQSCNAIQKELIENSINASDCNSGKELKKS